VSSQITIDGQSLSVDPETTILQAARQHGIYIPTLCDYPGLPAHGSCRMCIVEIQGRPNIPTACTTPAEPGMVIQTNSPKIQALRVELLQMLLADHPASCLYCPEKSHCDECMVTLHKTGVTTGCRSCPQDGQCAMQELVEKIGLPASNYPPRYRMLKVEKNDPFFDRDYNLCVLCGRCVRTCEKLHFSSSIAYIRRGTQTVVGTAFNRTHLAVGCTFCGACVEVCPTGALSEKTRKWEGEAQGETVTTCPLCSIGCQIRLMTKNGRVMGSLPDHQAGVDCLCVKGRFGITELVNHPTRLTQPQKSAAGNRRVNITWEETIRLAAEKLSATAPGRFEMVVSPNCTLESLYVAQKFTRQGMKSNSIHINCLNGYAKDASELFELLKQAQPLSILAYASTILCLGLEGKTSQTVVEVMLHQAKKAGASLVVALSGENNLDRFADLSLRSLPGNETALIDELAEKVNQPEGQSKQAVALVEQAAILLRKVPHPVILVGPAIFNHTDRRGLLQAINNLVRLCGASVVALPEQADLVGLLMGIPAKKGQSDDDVLYLLGENIPDLTFEPIERPFVLYQNIYPPAPGLDPDLLLPTTAFSEEDGSLVDYAGHVKMLHQAVPPPGQALPAWDILCRIARKMGLEGFDFTCVADIRAEMASLPGYWLVDDQVHWSAVSRPPSIEVEIHDSFNPQPIMDTYLGFPIAQFVQGLNQLIPANTRKNNG